MVDENSTLWTEEPRNEMRYLQVNDAHGCAVCYIAGRGDEYALRRFIAAAPETARQRDLLLEALKAAQPILEVMAGEDMETARCAGELAETAIAECKGGGQ